MSHYQERCAELEEVVELCVRALNFVPTEAIRRGYQWLPSEEALRAIERGRDAASRYFQDHQDRK